MVYQLVFSLMVFLSFGDDLPGNVVAVDPGDYSQCGVTTLFVACRLQGIPLTWEQANERMGPPSGGGDHSFADFSRAAESMGLGAIGLSVGWEELRELPLPAIAQMRSRLQDGNRFHFVVLLRVMADGVHVLDPPYAPFFFPRENFTDTWTGKLLLIGPEETLAPVRASAWRSWVAWGLIGLGGAGAGLLAAGFLWRIGMRLLIGFPKKPLRAYSYAGGALVLLTAGSVWYGVESQGPSCRFKHAIVNLGELAPGEHEHSLMVLNPGWKTLSIIGVTSSCTCAALDSPTSIEAGEQAVVRVRLQVGEGPQKALLTFRTNDPEGDKTVLIAWQGASKPRLVPALIHDYWARNDRPYERTLKLAYPGARSGPSPRLISCNCDSDRVKVEVGETDPKALQLSFARGVSRIVGEQELLVRVQPQAEGLFAASCQLTYEYGATKSVVPLPISVWFRPPEEPIGNESQGILPCPPPQGSTWNDPG